MIEEALYSAMAGTSALGDRIYPNELPERVTFPCARYMTVSETLAPKMDGNGDANIYQRRIQVDVLGNTYDEMRNARAELETAVQGYSGTLEGVQIFRIHRLNSVELPSTALERFRGVLDLSVLFRITS